MPRRFFVLLLVLVVAPPLWADDVVGRAHKSAAVVLYSVDDKGIVPNANPPRMERADGSFSFDVIRGQRYKVLWRVKSEGKWLFGSKEFAAHRGTLNLGSLTPGVKETTLEIGRHVRTARAERQAGVRFKLAPFPARWLKHVVKIEVRCGYYPKFTLTSAEVKALRKAPHAVQLLGLEFHEPYTSCNVEVELAEVERMRLDGWRFSPRARSIRKEDIGAVVSVPLSLSRSTVRKPFQVRLDDTSRAIQFLYGYTLRAEDGQRGPRFLAKRLDPEVEQWEGRFFPSAENIFFVMADCGDGKVPLVGLHRFKLGEEPPDKPLKLEDGVAIDCQVFLDDEIWIRGGIFRFSFDGDERLAGIPRWVNPEAKPSVYKAAEADADAQRADYGHFLAILLPGKDYKATVGLSRGPRNFAGELWTIDGEGKKLEKIASIKALARGGELQLPALKPGYYRTRLYLRSPD